jgi:membrane protease YdiL (CAAX protease family)
MTTRDPIEQRSPDRDAADTPASSSASFAQRRPVALFVLLALGIGWVVLGIPAVAGTPFAPFLLALIFLALLVPALVVSRMADGPGAIRQLLSRALIWRFSVIRWAIIVLGVPVLTLAVAAATGTLQSPEAGWADLITTYLIDTFITGLLIINLWEEMAWAGFAQTRLMASRGLPVGSLLTALAFGAIHIPLQFEGDWTWSDAGVGLASVFFLAPFARYLNGMHMLDTRGSVLAAGVQHAAWNAAQKLDAVEGGDWQMLGAVILLTLLLAVGRRVWRPEAHPLGTHDEKAAASAWTALRPARPRTAVQS